MKVFIVTDLEGVSGCVKGGHGIGIDPVEKERYLKLMMGEINAVVEGCVQAGVKEIIVGEAHPIDLEKLHTEAKLSRGIPWHEAMRLRKYDAALFVGQHARAGLSNAVRAHTGCSKTIVSLWINDAPMGELGYLGGYLGSLEIPVIFLSGDTAACLEARDLIKGPVETVEVEESHNMWGAVCLPPAKTHPFLIEGAKKAFDKLKDIDPILHECPVTIKIEFAFSKIADEFCFIPDIKRVDAKTVSYTADTYSEAYRICAIHSLIGRNY